MSVGDRIERLEPRERRLLAILASVFIGMLLLALPLGTSAMVSSRQSDNEELQRVIASIESGRARVRKAKTDHDALLQRYATPAPPLASMLAGFAKEVEIEIPESQDRASVPHGKRYEERSTKIVLRKVGMLALAKFMEKIETSHFPVLISQLNIRKRSTEPDSYDVDMTVSAYDRKADSKPEKAADSEEQPL
ncbi:MAG: hypothetical protein OZ921_05370 [Sorangiineae bacterium]|nr:hypothetical protein [Polyangiaceae bacterium]MEB2321923.1 hypothetical protein [Sorangiineae bacterium]